jgi:hypothetical protein
MTLLPVRSSLSAVTMCARLIVRMVKVDPYGMAAVSVNSVRRNLFIALHRDEFSALRIITIRS